MLDGEFAFGLRDFVASVRNANVKVDDSEEADSDIGGRVGQRLKRIEVFLLQAF